MMSQTLLVHQPTADALQHSLRAWLPAGVQALCTTREGGVSGAPFNSLNLGDHVQDNPAHVAENRQRLRQRLKNAVPIFLQQVHGTHVVLLHANTPFGIVADASVTHQSHVACTILVADCLPLLLTDASGHVVAAAHAGWRGLAAGVIEQTVQAMHAHPARELRAWLGPCIGPTAFEVGPEVREVFMATSKAAELCFKPHPAQAGKWLADLAGLARLRLKEVGVQVVAGNDSSSAWCTHTQNRTLFSYRRDGKTGRFAVCIWREA